MSKAANAYKEMKDELNYQVPSSRGGYIPADPIKFCLRYSPPVIAIVYKLLNKKKERKYVHEIKVDLLEKTDLSRLCD
jgi:hypothetical protein